MKSKLAYFHVSNKGLQASLTSRWLLMHKSTMENYSKLFHGKSNREQERNKKTFNVNDLLTLKMLDDILRM